MLKHDFEKLKRLLDRLEAAAINQDDAWEEGTARDLTKETRALDRARAAVLDHVGDMSRRAHDLAPLSWIRGKPYQAIEVEPLAGAPRDADAPILIKMRPAE